MTSISLSSIQGQTFYKVTSSESGLQFFSCTSNYELVYDGALQGIEGDLEVLQGTAILGVAFGGGSIKGTSKYLLYYQVVSGKGTVTVHFEGEDDSASLYLLEGESVREEFQVLHEETLETLQGKTFSLVTAENQELYFQGAESFTFYPENADFSFELEIQGDLNDLVGSPIKKATLSESGRYLFVTEKGLVTARFIITLASAELYRLEKLTPVTAKWFRVHFEYTNAHGVLRKNCDRDLRLEGHEDSLTGDAAKMQFLAQYPSATVTSVEPL